MKKQIILTILFILSCTCYCQEKTENVIVSSGNTIVMEGISLDWIIGSNLIDHQIPTGTHAPEQAFAGPEGGEEFLAFPTITRGCVQLVAKETEPEGLHVSIYDLSNKLLSRYEWMGNPMETDLSDYDHGMYIICIEQEDFTPLATFKIVRE